jgi:hypothetical protein
MLARNETAHCKHINADDAGGQSTVDEGAVDYEVYVVEPIA